jgi:hypothetical protein
MDPPKGLILQLFVHSLRVGPPVEIFGTGECRVERFPDFILYIIYVSAHLEFSIGLYIFLDWTFELYRFAVKCTDFDA